MSKSGILSSSLAPSTSGKEKLAMVNNCIDNARSELKIKQNKTVMTTSPKLRQLEKLLGTFDLITETILKIDDQDVEAAKEYCDNFIKNQFSLIPMDLRKNDNLNASSLCSYVFPLFYKLKKIFLKNDDIIQSQKGITSLNKLITMIQRNIIYALLDFKSFTW